MRHPHGRRRDRLITGYHPAQCTSENAICRHARGQWTGSNAGGPKLMRGACHRTPVRPRVSKRPGKTIAGGPCLRVCLHVVWSIIKHYSSAHSMITPCSDCLASGVASGCAKTERTRGIALSTRWMESSFRLSARSQAPVGLLGMTTGGVVESHYKRHQRGTKWIASALRRPSVTRHLAHFANTSALASAECG